MAIALSILATFLLVAGAVVVLGVFHLALSADVAAERKDKGRA